jgi:hypothetical protein
MRLSLRPVLLVALLGTAAAVPAFAQSGGGAQDSTVSTYAACTTKPSQGDTDAAHGAYMAGKGSFDEADYTTAINYFKDAYRRDCTKNELLEIIARAYELKGDRREAVHALETYVERAPTAADVDVQKRHIANLKREIAEQAAASSSASASASASVAPPASASASALPSATASVAPTTEPPPAAPPGGHTLPPWILVGVGGAALITGGVLYLVGSGNVSSAETNCPAPSHTGPNCSSSDASSGNSGRTLESVGVVAGSVGLAAVAGGLIWHFVEPTSSSTATQTGRPLVVPQVGPGYAGVGVGGRF